MASVVKEDEVESDSHMQSEDDYIVKARGFSYDATATDLCQFFAGCDIKGGKNNGIQFLYSRSGKSSEAYVEFYENEDLKRALSFNKKYLGDRYVDVTGVSREMMEQALAENEVRIDMEDSQRIVKLSGMPFTALHDDIGIFFAGCDIKGGKKRGISFLRNADGSAAGACFVEFLSQDDVKLALSKDRQYMGNRFCHVIKVSEEEREESLAKQTAALQDLKEPIIKLKGLPFKASESDIRDFFPDLEMVNIEMVLNEQGNCRGEAFIEYATLDEAKEAIKAYKLKLLHRYIDVTKSNRAEWMTMIPATDKVAKTADDLDEPILKLKNLPPKVTKAEIEDFLFGIECRAVQIVRLRGDCNGEAFIEFSNVEDAAKALVKNKQPLNGESGRDRVVEVTASSRCDWRKEPLPAKSSATTYGRRTTDDTRNRSPARSATRKRPLALDHSMNSDRDRHGSHPRIAAPVGYPLTYGYNANQIGYGDRPTVREYLVNMIGLPFSATEEDVKQFFHPIRMTEVDFLKNERGLPRGIAVVGFHSEEDRANAMLRNKNTIGTRYVNLHLRSEARDYNFDFSKGSALLNAAPVPPGGSRVRGEKRDSYDRAREVTYRDTRRDTYSRW